MATLLEARHITKVFGGGFFQTRNQTVAVEDFSLAIADEPPSITAVVGESGSGKTTLARLLLGVTAPTRGAVLYRGRDLTTLNREDRRGFLRDIQVIFQDPYEVYNPFYKIDHVLETPIKEFRLAKSADEVRDLMEKTLRAVGLRPEETLGRFPHQLSGGQRQRIMVARALLLHPRLIIADEPVSMVDASLRATILDNLRELNRQFGISIIYITHDLTTAYQISENIVVLYRGSVSEAGDVQKVVRDPQHPYTRLLIGSVPLPDPDRVWTHRMRVPDEDQPAFPIHGGCKFADRCPSMMEVCGQRVPPMFQTDPHRVARCFLYQSAPKIETEKLGDVFVSRSASAES
ncbi:MAG TPA: ABC transporter ATP-binding protein [Chloroflexota bacterium]|nr:ABC transporter ATP-binding protein [Chloroflexota bacterium]